MKAAVTVARAMISLFGSVALLLGLLFWGGLALYLMPLHMLLGIGVTFSLWLAAGLALRARVSIGLPLLALVWSLIMPALGVMQLRLLPGSLHWVIQLLHLLVGVVAMGLGHALARQTMRSLAALPRTPIAARS